MVSIDKRLNANEMHLLRQMIGRKIVSFLHDAFLKDIYSSFEVLGIETEQEISTRRRKSWITSVRLKMQLYGN